MKKRGLSQIITTLIMVLLVIVAIGIIWGVIRNVLEDSSEEITTDKIKISVELKSASIDDSTGNSSVTMKRNPGKSNPIGYVLTFTNKTESEQIKVYRNVSELETATFQIQLTKINASTVTSVLIASIHLSDSNKESYSNQLDEIRIKRGITNTPQVLGLCGDGIIDSGEVCDDSNSASGDGCSLTCQVESGWLCDANNDTTCNFDFLNDPNLAGYWELNGNALDSSSNGNDGTITNSADCSIPGKVGNACNFSGNGNLIQIPDSPSLNIAEDLSFSIWIYRLPDGPTPVTWRTFISKRNIPTTDNDFTFRFRVSTPAAQFLYARADTTLNIFGTWDSSNIVLGSWIHVVGIRDTTNGEMRIYFDGVGVDTYNNTVTTGILTGGNITLGGQPSGPGGQFSAYSLMDEVMIFSRALTDEEVLSIYNTQNI